MSNQSNDTATPASAHAEIGGAQCHVGTLAGKLWKDGQPRLTLFAKGGGNAPKKDLIMWDMLPDEALRLAEMLTANAIKARDHADELDKEYDDEMAEYERDKEQKRAELARVLSEVDEAARKLDWDRNGVLEWLAALTSTESSEKTSA